MFRGNLGLDWVGFYVGGWVGILSFGSGGEVGLSDLFLFNLMRNSRNYTSVMFTSNVVVFVSYVNVSWLSFDINSDM